MIRRANPYYRPETLLFCSQSNGLAFGSASTAWPPRELTDVSSAWYNNYYGWTSLTGIVANDHKGSICHCLMGLMRNRGKVPVIIHRGVAGSHSSYFATNAAEIAANLAEQYATLTEPTLKALVWFQGETDSFDGPGTTWDDNVATCVAAIRSAFGVTLPVVLVKTPVTYTAETAPYLAETRAAQDAFVASDGHATAVEDPSPTFVDGVHLDFASLRRTALLIDAVVGGL